MKKIKIITERGDISTDFILYDAVLRNLQTLSEATQHLPQVLIDKYDSIPWKNIKGFRNILVHNYLGDIDPNTVQKVLNEHIKALEMAVKSMLN